MVKGKLLLIDDNTDLLEYLANFFSIYNYEVIKAETGKKGLELFRHYLPDIVISDIRLPDVRGTELIGKIHGINEKTPIVVITAYADRKLILDALRKGAVEILKKPFRQRQLKYLINKIETIFRQRKVEISSRFLNWEKRILEIENDIFLIPSVVNFIFSSIDYLCRDDSLIRLGLQEIVINAIEHGNLEISSEEKNRMLEKGNYAQKLVKRARKSRYRDRRVSLRVFSNPDYFKIIVEDQGPGFDTGKLPDITRPDNLLQESGKGILMAMNAFDRVGYNDRGNRVTLLKHSEFREDHPPKYLAEDEFDTRDENTRYSTLKEQFDFELNLAAEFQNTFLPRKDELAKFPDIHCDYIYQPLIKVSGDYLDINQLEEGIYSCFIADISGHGVAAALISSMLKVFFSLYAKDVLSSELLFEMLNQEFSNYLNLGEYFTSFYGIYFHKEKKFVYTNANHPAPLLLRHSTREIIPLSSRGFFVGIFKDTQFEEKEVVLEKNDRILFFTDGILEAKNAAGEEFGIQRIKEVYLREYRTTVTGMLEALMQAVNRFSGRLLEDDLTLAGMEIK